MASPRLRSTRNLKWKLDYSSFVGLALALSSAVAGLLMEGGSISDIRQGAALLIVLGGTIGAVLFTTPTDLILRTLRRLPRLFYYRETDNRAQAELIATLAVKARRAGIISLEDEIRDDTDPFLRRALELAVDGFSLQECSQALELEIELAERAAEAEAQVMESAGGYAPTMGILGAVLGLIQVMKHLENIDEVGRGIAVAFVATLYGIGFANFVFIPAAGKLRARSRANTIHQELISEGIAAILEGHTPSLIRKRLRAYEINPEEHVRQRRPAGSPALSAAAQQE